MDIRLLVFTVIAFASMSLAAAQERTTGEEGGFVYVATNQPTGNTVLQFSRAADGVLTKRAESSTGGRGGTGNGVGALDPLGSQNSLVLLDSGRRVLVVNAGSNSLTSLAAGAETLEVISRVDSGGQFPNSIAAHEDIVYVLNAHGTPNVTGFRMDTHGRLRAIPGSSRDLPSGPAAAPHDVRFTPDGMLLLVSEGGTNRIDVFELHNDGLLSLRSSQPASGSGPFGLNFGPHEALVVANANSASLSSYALRPDGTLEIITGSLPDGQVASCWVTLTRDRRQAFISNTGSGTLSTYEVGADGHLQLSAAVAAAVANSGPIDSAISENGRFLYVDDSALGRVLIFAVKAATLTLQGQVQGLPTTLQGVAAR